MSHYYPGPEDGAKIRLALASLPLTPPAPYISQTSPTTWQIGPLQGPVLHADSLELHLSTDGGETWSLNQSVNPTSGVGFTANPSDQVRFVAVNPNGTTEGPAVTL